MFGDLSPKVWAVFEAILVPHSVGIWAPLFDAALLQRLHPTITTHKVSIVFDNIYKIS